MPTPLPTVLVLYHFLYPDDVVSAVLFSELCAGLAARGWRVVGSSCNRGWSEENQARPLRSSWNGVEFRRVWRPGFRQSSGFGRMTNAAWMIAAWSLMAFDPRIRPDVVIVGTDPVLSPLVALAWRALRPRVRVAHWCFDLYPEAAIAAGLLSDGAVVVRILRRLLSRAYRKCSLIVDIGVCMRRRLEAYGSKARQVTIPPWALAEPENPAQADPAERQALFGDASIGLLYSGSFGRAHSWRGIPELAGLLAPSGGRIVFSVQGNAVEELRQAIRNSASPIGFVPFAPSQLLEARLGAADVHIVSLREDWTGTVVPSKFFGALAVGRPVLFIGSRDSALAQWIEEFRIGWVLTPENLESVARELVASLQPEAKGRLFEHCQEIYRRRFSRKQALDRWHGVLRGLDSQS